MRDRKLDDVNIIIVSDHGFADVSGYVYLDECIPDIHNYVRDETLGNSPIVFIHTKSDGKSICMFYVCKYICMYVSIYVCM